MDLANGTEEEIPSEYLEHDHFLGSFIICIYAFIYIYYILLYTEAVSFTRGLPIFYMIYKALF